MGLMRNCILSNVHLSRLSLKIQANALWLNKKLFVVSVSDSFAIGAGYAASCILSLSKNNVLKAKKDYLKFKHMYTFFGNSFNQIYGTYFFDLASFIANWNSVTARITSANEFLIRVDWCTNFYNAYPNLSWFDYIENPSFSISFLPQEGVLEDKKLQFLYLSAYFNVIVKT